MNKPFYRHRSLPLSTDSDTKALETASTHTSRQAGYPFWALLVAVLVTAALTAGLTLGVVRLRQGHAFGVVSAPSATGSGATAGTNAPADGHDAIALLTVPKTEAAAKAADKLAHVYRLLRDNYYESMTDADLIERMTQGLTDTMGSQYTFYLTKEANEQIEDVMRGAYEGIGATVEQIKPGVFRINDLVQEGPAFQSGLRVGDRLIKVDGRDVSSFRSVAELVTLVRGQAGTKVTLTVHRDGDGQDHEITITRAAITTANTKHRMLTPTIGYIQLTEFSKHVSDNFIAAVKSLMKDGAKDIVIDLRNNGGGLADECVHMVDFLTKETVIATIKGRHDGKPFEQSWTGDAKQGVPETMRYAIVLNGHSASASELFSGALHDFGLATLVGERSFGKGVGTVTYPLNDGSAIQVTNFAYYLPKGESIEGKGLKPDIEVTLPDSVKTLPIAMLSAEDDTQLARAIEVLKAHEAQP